MEKPSLTIKILLAAVERGMLQVVREFIASAGGTPDQSELSSVIQIAIVNGHKKILKLVIELVDLNHQQPVSGTTTGALR